MAAPTYVNHTQLRYSGSSTSHPKRRSNAVAINSGDVLVALASFENELKTIQLH